MLVYLKIIKVTLNEMILTQALTNSLYERSWFIMPGTDKSNTNVVPLSSTNKPAIAYLGNNKKGIVIVTAYDSDVYLPHESLQFLTSVLQACKLTITDVALVNNTRQPLNWQLLQQLQPLQFLLLFGLDVEKLGLPAADNFTINTFNNITWISSPALEMLNAPLEEAKLLKSKLWGNLKQLFL
jgi:hypothetical protein